jgi:hypothetical protein
MSLGPFCFGVLKVAPSPLPLVCVSLALGGGRTSSKKDVVAPIAGHCISARPQRVGMHVVVVVVVRTVDAARSLSLPPPPSFGRAPYPYGTKGGADGQQSHPRAQKPLSVLESSLA